MLASRRHFLTASAALTLSPLTLSPLTLSPLALPAVARSATATTLKFIPQIDLAFLDPHWTTAYITRGHAYMVFDTLYGQDGSFTPQPQMVEGHVVENDGRLWNLTLRQGLLWHDGTRVLARDCVASIRRWAARDAFGAQLMATTDELSGRRRDLHHAWRSAGGQPGALRPLCYFTVT